MTAVVTGASRGFGRAIAGALVESGSTVVGVARTSSDLDEARRVFGDRFVPVAADAASADTAARVLAEHKPSLLVLDAAAVPAMAPLPEQTWEGFSRSWHVDVRQAFEWLGAALRLPLPPGSQVVVFSSGAALRGSPLSGGYAGAKATVRFVTGYAAQEAERAGLDLRFLTVLPGLTPTTDHGRAGAAGYAARQGVSLEEFTKALGPALTPELVASTLLDLLHADDAPRLREVWLDGNGARPLD
jgi:NAD(P)-dependent dehydrogenase (short-subunit alcohol dehydrogenase family)